MDKLDWQLIEVFLRVAQEGSFTAAAETLGTSQPTVSRQIRALEESIGVSLFARHARGFELSERGQALVESARQVDLDVQTFWRRAIGMKSEVGGTVRISASEPVSAYLLPGFLAEFFAEHPAIDIELVAANKPSNLLRREADIAIRMFEPRQLDLVIRRVAELPLALFAHESYLARRGVPEHADELCDHVTIGYDADPTGFEALAEYGIGREDLSLRTDSLVTQFEAIRAGVGIGGAQVAVAQHDEGLRQVLSDVDIGTMHAWLAVHPDLRHNPTIRAVFDALATFFGDL